MVVKGLQATLIALGVTTWCMSAAAAQGVIKIGEINSYKALPQTTGPYKHGWLLAQEEINKSGGILGKKMETIFRDDNANPGDAVRVAEELLTREKVDVLSGVTLSHIGVALADFAVQRKTFFFATGPMSDKVVWEHGNRYTYRLRPGTYASVAAVVPAAAKLNKKRWALIYPNYEYGQAAAAAFKQELKKLQPDVEFVAEQAPPMGKLEAGALVQSIADAKPDAIFNALFGSDLIKLAREGRNRGLFEGREVVSLLTGEPEYLDPLRSDAPASWVTTGYPFASIANPEHQAFVQTYQAKYKEHPRMNSLVGYLSAKVLAAGIEKAGATDTEKLITSFKSLNYKSPIGDISFRKQDNQSTMGVFVGKTVVNGGKGGMSLEAYIDGNKLSPADDVVQKLRAKGH